VQKRAVALGLDWPSADQVLVKVKEELRELELAMENNVASQREELGDLLFSCVNLARHLKLDAEQSLREVTRKFEQRARAYVDLAAREEVDLSTASDEVKDQLWDRVKLGFNP
jgi:ATP diphosphatase